MSKRAEQKAEEYEKSLNYYHYTSDNPSVAYKAGYKQAINDAITYLKAHANDYIVDLTPTYPDAPSNIIVGGMLYVNLEKELIG